MSNRAVTFLGTTVSRSIFTILSSTTSSLPQACQAHAQVLKTGLLNDTSLSTKLVSLYANGESFTDAILILDSLPQPDLPSFSVLIYGLSKFNLPTGVLRVFAKMISRGVSPDSRVLPAIAKACASLGCLRIGRQVHGIVSASGFASDAVVQSSLLHMYLKCNEMCLARKMFDQMCEPSLVALSALVAGYARKGCVDEAKWLFNRMSSLGLEPNLVSWNGMIAGFNQSGLYREAVNIFQELHSQGLHPDENSISSALAALGDLEGVSLGIQIHDYVIKEGLFSDKWIVSALIDMYGKCGYTAEMLQVFDEANCMESGSCSALIAGLSRNGLVDNALSMIRRIREQGLELSIISWTSMIACCSQNGKDIEALDLFRDMQLAGVKPNSFTIPCLLPACGNIASLMHGKSVHCFSLRSGFIDVYVGSALIDMYAKCGKIRESRLCFDTMPDKNVVSWNAIISGYAMHGESKEAMEIFDSMQKFGQFPDSITFTCVISACSQKGLTDEGWFYFNSMCKEHGIEAKTEHYACMVNLLSRAGRLEEAYSMIKDMPFKPDACVWGSLLSSCRVHNNLSLAEVAAAKLFELEPGNPGNYVILANMYASKGMWKEEARVRNLMKETGVKKNPGCSWIELKNKVHMLLAGDKSFPQMTQILEKLDALNMEMKKLGLDPRTDFVLQDVEEQDKELILCGHSEKLAVAFGILNTPRGHPLRVIKNLRICGDCHTVIKFISSFENREISVRDTNRFHHFKDGECSCGDYW